MIAGRIAGIAFLLLSTTLGAHASDKSDLCDRLAASPLDATRPAGVSGVLVAGIETDKAIAACEAATAEKPADGRLQFQLGRAYEAKEADGPAAQAYKKSADTAHVGGMSNYGSILEHGRGVAKDETAAAKWYRAAADGGLVRAKVNLGNLLRDGRGVAKDSQAAFGLFTEAAKAGDGDAMYQAGLMLEYGDGIPADIVGALAYYKASAEAGEASGHESMGTLLEDGRGTAKDEAGAVAAYRAAIEAGSEWAKVALAGMLHDGRGATADKDAALAMLREGFSDEETRTDTISNAGFYYNEITRKAVQDMLKQAGLFKGKVDGVFGEDTTAAIEAFLKLPPK